ncbi:unnamed protein product [Gulo gulo]|uniref:Uncharacterized protein n=1 Tax=Gulo gulo TaxID=48420 RepID=A0A9X9MCM6_GULGU|nr:unnamed protein product [Gulo gulo]
MPATPVGTSSWMQTAWPSTCGSTRPRRWSCSRQTRTSTSSTGRAARGRPGRCCRLGSWSSALGMRPMASPLWQRRPPQPLNVRRLLSEQVSLLVTVYLRMDGTLHLRGVAPFPRENKFDYFLMLPRAPCGGVGGSWQSCGQCHGRAAPPRDRPTPTCFPAKPGCPSRRMGLVTLDPSGKRTGFLVLSRGLGSTLGAGETVALHTPTPHPVSSLGFSPVQLQDLSSPLRHGAQL